jgi:hypothetical protein
VELHGCCDNKVIVRVPAWEAVGYNDRRIMMHPLKDKAMVWMEDQDDPKNHSLSLELVSGDSLNWRAIIRGKVSNGGVLEHAGGDGKRSLEVMSADESEALDMKGGKRMKMGNTDAFSVNTPAVVIEVLDRSVSPTSSPGKVDSGEPSLVRLLRHINPPSNIYQTDGGRHVGNCKVRTDRRCMVPFVWIFK